VPFQTGNIKYSAYDPDQPGDVTVATVNEFNSYSLPEDKTMKPIRMEVHDSSDLRGHIPKRITLLAGNKTTLRTFELSK
jgi:anaphase-promoting complex subunit 4